jgi:hypothetical protein
MASIFLAGCQALEFVKQARKCKNNHNLLTSLLVVQLCIMKYSKLKDEGVSMSYCTCALLSVGTNSRNSIILCISAYPIDIAGL